VLVPHGVNPGKGCFRNGKGGAPETGEGTEVSSLPCTGKVMAELGYDRGVWIKTKKFRKKRETHSERSVEGSTRGRGDYCVRMEKRTFRLTKGEREGL